MLAVTGGNKKSEDRKVEISRKYSSPEGPWRAAETDKIVGGSWIKRVRWTYQFRT
jgi:hypothetical protein